ncbi:MAG: hypothetical protein GQ550_01775 [Gammaproteobacteria bacterium]|nr:hypothetical protein [Gammaproteobacteria bacterium]
MGNYNFDHIAYFAKRRFIEGRDTIVLLAELLAAAKTEREKEEIALVSSLQLENDNIRELQVRCRYAGQCKTNDGQCRTSDCIKKLKKMMEQELEKSTDG